ncbi:MAG: TlpA family protein disulfide reductase [Candidatus Eremiobacteraeota bacterium]|nr:TlpA family protein disulfide reductase [Candidatus Eremiobacteraeota bacterium]
MKQAQNVRFSPRAAIFALLAIVVAVGAWTMLGRRAAPSASTSVAAEKLAVGGAGPEFAVSTTHGLFDLKDVRQPVLLEVFATWCPHCQRETTTLNALEAAYGRRLRIVAVSGSDTGMDHQTAESQNDVLQFAQRFNVKYAVGYDPSLRIAQQYLADAFPTMVVFDRAHRVVAKGSGEMSMAQLRKWLRDAGVEGV